MNWATFAIEKLQQGQQAQVKPRGHSMTGKVNDGDLVTLQPCPSGQLQVGDIVLVQVKGKVYLHLIKAIDQQRFLIGNNRGGINGWVGPHAIYGRATQIQGRQKKSKRVSTRPFQAYAS
jgi:SOS-response transcriptional repressor LexA